MSISVCTIIARNYLALAKTLGESLRMFHPLVDFHVLVVDPFELPVKHLELSRSKLDSPTDFIDEDKFNRLAYEYDITELSTAVKPFYLEYLLLQGYAKVIYLDPDILILQPINQIFQALDSSNIVLTPHLLDPIPLDGCFPSEITILQAGAYNLGFIGISRSEETHNFLTWWGERLEKYCRVAHTEGLFVDQKWIDLVPGLFEKVQILSRRGYNVAYWNLNARHLSEHEGIYWVDNEPVVFFHFSGFNPDFPTRLSKYQNRLSVEALPSLANLLQHYACLLKANGHDKYKHLLYGYSTFSNGVPIDSIARSLLTSAQQSGMSFPNPLDADAEPSFFRWLISPVGDQLNSNTNHYITNYLFGLYQRRLDLKGAYPDVLRTHRNEYLAWVKAEATNLNIHVVYLPWVPLSGVNVAGYLTAEVGVGEAARGYVAALKSLGVQTAFTDFAVGTLSRKEDKTLSGFSSTNPYPINLVCINADQVPNFIAHVGSQYFEQKHNIGVWWWELPELLEEWRDRFADFNEIWVGSTFTYQSISKHSPIPVSKIPPVVQVELSQVYPKEHFGLADSEFIFLFVFDFLSYFARKNPTAIAEAFKKAFHPDEPVRLVFKCINGEHDPDNFNCLKNAIDDARITIIDSYLSKDEKNGLINACDCYVSLHRAEGFGLTLAEAMLLEKPVIGTGWSGNMDFMTINNSYPVEYELTRIITDHGPYYRRGQIWAEPSIQHAAQLMREVYDHPEAAKKKAKRAAADIHLMHSPAAVAKVVKARLEVIQSVSPHVTNNTVQQRQPEPPLNVVSNAPSAPLEAIIESSDWAESSRFGILGRLSKKIIERIIRFYVAYQDIINRKLFAYNQILREQSQQQQNQINTLQNQIISLNERFEAHQLEMRQGSKALENNLKLLSLNQSVQEQAQQNRVNALEGQIASVVERVAALQANETQQRIEDCVQRIDTLNARFSARPYMQMPIFSLASHGEKRSLGYESSTTELHEQFDYLGFEEVFRGAESFIKERQSVYTRFFTDKNLVLDVGSGRGEFLELLTEAGIRAIGIDINPDMVKRCARKGLTNVVLQDCNEYLKTIDENSIDGIFSAQFIEHLPFDKLYEFLTLSWKKLSLGGIFIAETVNPHCIEAMKTFYVDLTHIKPLFPEVMLFLCRSAGFSKAEVFYPNGHGFSEEEYWLQGEYAVVARK